MHPLDLAVIIGYLGTDYVCRHQAQQPGERTLTTFSSPADPWLGGWLDLSIIGTNIDTNSYVGASGNAYSVGIAQANFEWIGAIPAMIIASLIFIPLYWRAGVYSIPGVLRTADTTRAFALWRLLLASVFAVFALGVAMWALALTLETYLGWPIWVGILVSGTVVGLYSIAGGLAAVAITDSIQVSIMFLCGILIVGIGISDAGGFGAFATTLTQDNPNHLQAYLPADSEDFPWPGVILGLGFVLSPAYWIGSQSILQRTLGARTQWDASASMMFAALAKTFIPLLVVFPGILALVMKADIEYPDMALPWVIKNVLPPGISGLMFVAIIAALQSSIDSGVNSTSLMITRDIRHVLIKNHNPEKDLIVGRYLTLVLLLSSMCIAPFIGDLGGIFTFLQTILSLFQGPMLALLLLGAMTQRATPMAGLWTLVSGVLVSAVLLLALEWNLLYVAFVSFCYSMIALWTVSGFTEKLSDEKLATLTYRPWSRT